MKITDKQRLNFIEKHSCDIACDSVCEKEKWIVSWSRPSGAYKGDGGWMPTLRGAVDSAMRIKRKTK